MSGSVNDSRDKSSIMDGEEKEERIVDIYITAEAVRDIKHKKQTEESETTTKTTTQQPEHKGSECARNRCHRSVLVCLVLLCVLLLTAVIVLCVLIYTNNHQFHINNKKITQERDQLLTKYTNITEERDQLLTKYTNITEDRDQLLTKYTNITEERDELKVKCYNATELYKQINWKTNLIWTHFSDGWIEQEVRLYLISSELKNWTESRSYCRDRGADLIIINNKEEQDFVNNITSGAQHWIGLSDSDVEGTWKWVDGSTLTSGFWEVGQPGYHRLENCALSQPEWHDYPCTSFFKSICEKKIF
ncbi:CD209 antigen-like protein C isoform X1 [Triplophysa dalaica]|uniref:CD209 antigen-like protein C isoform X1 n=1 Tax=Triplophysa dalaica TaxID=1582913 RepID=UPI0024DFFC12|nr:CD209 antigen-like protein C isoform X1 [Triplophysa dalaica]